MDPRRQNNSVCSKLRRLNHIKENFFLLRAKTSYRLPMVDRSSRPVSAEIHRLSSAVPSTRTSSGRALVEVKIVVVVMVEVNVVVVVVVVVIVCRSYANPGGRLRCSSVTDSCVRRMSDSMQTGGA